MRFPDGHHWEDPNFPSFVVPYGKTSDFFFSGHCGFLNIATLEWWTLGRINMFCVTLAINIYMMLVLLAFRVHYTIDITTGLIVSHYCFLIIKRNQENIDNFLIFVYSKMICRKNWYNNKILE